MKTLLALLLALMPLAAHAGEDGDRKALAECFQAWGKTPFGGAEKARFKTLSTAVKVFGLGGAIEDTEVTAKPALILVKPAVNVLGGSTYRLMNPNGWYCMKANVNVLGKSRIKTHCKTHLATTGSGANVLGSDDDQKAVTVLGSTKVEREGCGEKGGE